MEFILPQIFLEEDFLIRVREYISDTQRSPILRIFLNPLFVSQNNFIIFPVTAPTLAKASNECHSAASNSILTTVYSIVLTSE